MVFIGARLSAPPRITSWVAISSNILYGNSFRTNKESGERRGAQFSSSGF
jgi:hypothetical protein